MPRGGRREGSGNKKGVKLGPYAQTLAKRAGRQKALNLLEVTEERTMLEIARIAFAHRASIWRDGRLLPFDEWPEDALALLEGFEVVVKNAAAGDGHTDTVHKVHLAKKLGALEILAKHFGIVQDKPSVTVNIEQQLLRLEAGYQRAKCLPPSSLTND
jgi:hypothetical protein